MFAEPSSEIGKVTVTSCENLTVASRPLTHTRRRWYDHRTTVVQTPEEARNDIIYDDSWRQVYDHRSNNGDIIDEPTPYQRVLAAFSRRS